MKLPLNFNLESNKNMVYKYYYYYLNIANNRYEYGELIIDQGEEV